LWGTSTTTPCRGAPPTGGCVVATNVYKDVAEGDENNLWKLLDPKPQTTSTKDQHHVVSVLEPVENNHKIITEYKDLKVTYYTSDLKTDGKTEETLEIVKQASIVKTGTTLFLLPLRQKRSPPLPPISEATMTSTVSTSTDDTPPPL
jgi:hypothetical protein